MQNSWIDTYYDSLEFFYWEPQHLGKKKHDNAEFKSLKHVQKHVRNMEVTLNHNIQQFFSLAPNELRNNLFLQFFNQEFSGIFSLDERDVDKKYNLVNSTQPDIVFTSPTTTVSIEMKVGAKSTITQVLKYALLSLAIELIDGVKRSHYLGLLGPGTFTRQWKEAFTTPEDLRVALMNADTQTFIAKQPAHFRSHRERFKEILANLVIGFQDYESFADVLLKGSPNPDDKTNGAEVYRNLISGMVGELKFRKLIQ